jgi:beta-glucanase (GH16 family)
MEVLGNQTNIAYGTVHYGEPHAEQQGIYTLDEGTFADDFHEYSIEWEPGEMRWYIDGNLYNTVNDWYTKVDGEEMKDYPAPFNQLFFIQMNLAVGGDWPGNPDETTNFDNAVFQIDYVRVYQKAEYDTDVTRPEQEFRTTTADGNLVWNGDFAEAEPLDDEENWFFLLFYGGEGEAQISDGEMIITSSKAGTEEYSVQLVQPDLPLIQGTTYKLTFEACAEEDRTMIIAVTAPNVGWIRYLKDTKIDLTPDYQEFEFEFTMNDADDNYGRLEFNMGAQGSTSTIYIKNVRIEIVE